MSVNLSKEEQTKQSRLQTIAIKIARKIDDFNDNLVGINIYFLAIIVIILLLAISLFLFMYQDIIQGLNPQYTGVITNLQYAEGYCYSLMTVIENQQVVTPYCYEDAYYVTLDDKKYEVSNQLFRSVKIGQTITLPE